MEDIMDNRRDEFDFANRYLVGDEFILWKGQPERGSLLSKMDIFLIPFSILWASFVLMAVTSVLSEGDPFTMLFLIPFVCVGFYITVGRFIHASVRRKQTRYVITNKKIIRKIGNKTDVLDGQNLPVMHIEFGKDGNGTICFGYADQRNNMIKYSEYAFVLENIKEPLKVQEIIKTMDK